MKAEGLIMRLARLARSHTGKWPPLGYGVLTVPEGQRWRARSRAGANGLRRAAHEALAQTLGLDPSEVAMFAAFHPTSSKRPWLHHPHVQFTWIHARIRPDRIDWLPWSDEKEGRILDPSDLIDAWSQRIMGAQHAWVRWMRYRDGEYATGDGFTLAQQAYYDLRSMWGDVWHALHRGFRGDDGPRLIINTEGYRNRTHIPARLIGLDPEGQDCGPLQVAQALDTTGMVGLWYRWRRLATFGPIAQRTRDKIAATLASAVCDSSLATIPERPESMLCPCCAGEGRDVPLQIDRIEHIDPETGEAVLRPHVVSLLPEGTVHDLTGVRGVLATPEHRGDGGEAAVPYVHNCTMNAQWRAES